MVVTSGLFTGGVLVIAWERIPVWRALPLPQFRTDFATAIRFATACNRLSFLRRSSLRSGSA
jgi:hypothetical protein